MFDTCYAHTLAHHELKSDFIRISIGIGIIIIIMIIIIIIIVIIILLLLLLCLTQSLPQAYADLPGVQTQTHWRQPGSPPSRSRRGPAGTAPTLC